MAERNAVPHAPAQSGAERPRDTRSQIGRRHPELNTVDLVFTRRGTDFTPGLPTDTELLDNNRALFP